MAAAQYPYLRYPVQIGSGRARGPAPTNGITRILVSTKLGARSTA